MPDWIRETPAHWDADKQRVLGGLAPTLFGFGSPDDSDALGDEWWRVEDGGRVVGYGRLDDTWGDAEILVLVEPGARRSGSSWSAWRTRPPRGTSTSSTTSCPTSTPTPRR